MTARAILAALALALAAACAGGDDAREYPEYGDADPGAVADVRATLTLAEPAAEGLPGEQAWALVVETCRQLDAGAEPAELVADMGESGFTASLAAAVMVSATLDVCPHNADAVAEWMA